MEEIIYHAKALDEAGVFAMVLECIPSGVAKVIRASVNAVTIGVGAGPLFHRWKRDLKTLSMSIGMCR